MFCSNAIDTVKMTLLCFEGGKLLASFLAKK